MEDDLKTTPLPALIAWWLDTRHCARARGGPRREDDMEKPTPATEPEALTPSTVDPSSDSLAPLPPSTIFGALIDAGARVWTNDVGRVRSNDLEEMNECRAIIVGQKTQLERVRRAGWDRSQLAWKIPIHMQEIERAVGRLQKLGAFFRRDHVRPASADERRPG